MNRNIVLISVDSLRADMCPWLVDTDHRTPTISDNSESGLSFTNAISPGHATPRAMPQIFTGHSMPTIDEDESAASVVQLHETIPEFLSEQGYTTVGFTPNPFTSREFGFDAGFDYFQDFFDQKTTVFERIQSYVRNNWRNKPSAAIRLILNLSGRGDITIKWRDYYEDLTATIEDVSQPFFLWVFLLEPHWPYFPSKEYRDGISFRELATNYKRSQLSNSEITEIDRSRLLQLYRNTIKDVDDFVKQLQSDLSEYDPAYIFHSDHGESFGEHGNWGHQKPLYKENIHVPLEVWNTKTSGDISAPISLRQIPLIIKHILRDIPEEIPQLAHSYGRACNWDETSLQGHQWFHYPDGNIEAPGPIKPLANTILNQEIECVDEERRIRKAARDVAQNLI